MIIGFIIDFEYIHEGNIKKRKANLKYVMKRK